MLASGGASPYLPARPACDGTDPMRDLKLTGYTPKLTPGVTPEEKTVVHSRKVACNNGGGAMGHPTIYMRIEDKEVTCPYCSRTFVLAEGAGDDAHH
ncbi:zinc-finger domain-containing protein [Pseudoroseomonas globiformis]|uniref:Zinc-finger domain-containing protein n=1 Tax=Teichococcus globiformis TaxID=2307229 RepID=A0ABV7G1E0_9PROT